MARGELLTIINPIEEQEPFHHPDKLSGEEIALHWPGIGPRQGSSNAWVSVIQMEPGRSSTFHLHPENEEFFVVAQGRGLVREGDGEKVTNEYGIGPYDIIFAPEGIAKQILNTGEAPMRLIQVYAPPPKSDTFEGILRNEELAVHLDGRS